MITVSQCVTRAPPSLSESHPPTGRTSDPTKGPSQAHCRGLGAFGLSAPSGSVPNTSWMSLGNAAEYPMNDPKVIV
jgi:hypothetical protein